MMNNSTTSKQKLLHALYDQAAEIYADTKWSCKKGCSSCCTQSVTITTLEGRVILEYLQGREDNERFFPALQKSADKAAPAQITTNSLARSCLKGHELEQFPENRWNFTPCIFLENNCCAIYPARPFACRCFLSKQPCAEFGHAVVEPETITINTVFQQIVEHVDRGGYWGNLAHVLTFLRGEQENANPRHGKKISPCIPLPGFALSPEEKEQTMRIVNALFRTPVGDETFVELMKKVVSDYR